MNKHEEFLKAYDKYPSQDNEGYMPDRGSFKCGFFAAWTLLEECSKYKELYQTLELQLEKQRKPPVPQSKVEEHLLNALNTCMEDRQRIQEDLNSALKSLSNITSGETEYYL